METAALKTSLKSVAHSTQGYIPLSNVERWTLFLGPSTGALTGLSWVGTGAGAGVMLYRIIAWVAPLWERKLI